jgi:p-aminobenzoyl-glutamate transporter AbgT
MIMFVIIHWTAVRLTFIISVCISVGIMEDNSLNALIFSGLEWDNHRYSCSTCVYIYIISHRACTYSACFVPPPLYRERIE